MYVPSLDLEVSRHINQLRSRISDKNTTSGNNKIWDTDVVPDVEQDISQDSPTDETSDVDKSPEGLSSPSRLKPREDENESFITPPSLPRNPRRRELTPVRTSASPDC